MGRGGGGAGRAGRIRGIGKQIRSLRRQGGPIARERIRRLEQKAREEMRGFYPRK